MLTYPPTGTKGDCGNSIRIRKSTTTMATIRRVFTVIFYYLFIMPVLLVVLLKHQNDEDFDPSFQ
jgi:Trk-type K+ transport system membrane component